MTVAGNWTAGPYVASEMVMGAKLWASLNDGSPLHIVQSGWDGVTGDVLAVVWADDDSDEAAQARLFAAAPDLADAVANLLGLFDNPVYRRRLHDDELYAEAIAHARTALKLARGEQPS